MGTVVQIFVLAILSIGLWACGSSGGSGPDASTPDASPDDSSCVDGGAGSRCDAEAAPSPNVDASTGLDGSVADAAALDSGRDSQESDGTSPDGGALDGSTFVCGSVHPVTCAEGTQYCMITPSNQGELPMPVNTCEALGALPCFSTNAGCNCGNVPLDAGAGSCRCLESDASPALALTIDCF
jgi:hypothetical protein